MRERKGREGFVGERENGMDEKTRGYETKGGNKEVGGKYESEGEA